MREGALDGLAMSVAACLLMCALGALGCGGGDDEAVDASAATDATVGVDASPVRDASVAVDASSPGDGAVGVDAPMSSTDAGGDDAGTTAPARCASVTELATPNGLTDAMRLPAGVVTGPLLPMMPLSLLQYTAVFGTAPNTYPPTEPDPTGFGFPGTNRNRLTFNLPAGRYIAMEFRVPTDPRWDGTAGFHMLIPAATFATATIAPCPGQFTTDARWPVSPSCTVFGEDNLTWRIGGTVGCVLRPGATYYLNVINASADTPTMSTCTSSTCQFKLLPSFMIPP